MPALLVRWASGATERHRFEVGATVTVGPPDGPVLATVPLYRPDGPTLCTVIVRGEEQPGIQLDGRGRPRKAPEDRAPRKRYPRKGPRSPRVPPSPERAAVVRAAVEAMLAVLYPRGAGAWPPWGAQAALARVLGVDDHEVSAALGGKANVSDARLERWSSAVASHASLAG